jgi:hypothetical protein
MPRAITEDVHLSAVTTWMYLCCDRMDLGTPLRGVRRSSELAIRRNLFKNKE